jgi:hypothetical protein
MGQFNQQIKAEVMPKTIPGGEFKKTGTVFGDIIRQDTAANTLPVKKK